MREHFSYPYNSSIAEKVLSVLTLFEDANVAELASEIAELEGIATEEGLAECTIETQEALRKLAEAGSVGQRAAVVDAQSRYSLIKQ